MIADKHKDFNLTIYGEGGLRTHLEGLIAEKGLQDRISLPGKKPNVLEWVKDSYASVLSSDFEVMPNVLIEAMVQGLSCISTD